MLAGERAGGEQKIILCRGTPAQFFFSVLTYSFSSEFLVIFKRILLKSSVTQICLGWVCIVIFNSLKSRPTLHFQNV